MENSCKYAWAWKVKPEYIVEYVQMHLNTWEDVLREHSAAGIRNYSIFQNGNQFFYCFECDDVDAAFFYLNRSEPCQRWNSITNKMMEKSFNFGEANPIDFLTEIFYMK
jgi:L-rhamnose mutarotase